MQEGPCLSPYRHLKVDGAVVGPRGPAQGTEEVWDLAGIAKWIGRRR